MVASDQGLGAREACQVVPSCLKAGHRACRDHCRFTDALPATLAWTVAANVTRDKLRAAEGLPCIFIILNPIASLQALQGMSVRGCSAATRYLGT